MKRNARHLDSEFWFTARYAAKLLGTTRAKIENMVVREFLRSRGEGNDLLIADVDVTRLRRSPADLAVIKKAAVGPAYPRQKEAQPRETLYFGNAPKPELKVKDRIGTPLADQGHSKKR